jgi:hypothetical protein
MILEVDLGKTEQVWQSCPSIVAAWSFGSTQDGRIPFSYGLNLAVLFFASPDFEVLCDIRADLQEILEVDDIGLMSLNTAEVINAMEAIRGTSLFCRDLGKRAEFVSLTSRQYEDDMAQLKRHYYS